MCIYGLYNPATHEGDLTEVHVHQSGDDAELQLHHPAGCIDLPVN